jgi:hypothetical protein
MLLLPESVSPIKHGSSMAEKRGVGGLHVSTQRASQPEAVKPLPTSPLSGVEMPVLDEPLSPLLKRRQMEALSKNQQAVQKLQETKTSPIGVSYEAKSNSASPSGRFADDPDPGSPKWKVLSGNIGISTKDTKIKDMSQHDEPASPKRHVSRTGRLMEIVGKRGPKEPAAAEVKEMEDHF